MPEMRSIVRNRVKYLIYIIILLLFGLAIALFLLRRGSHEAPASPNPAPVIPAVAGARVTLPTMPIYANGIALSRPHLLIEIRPRIDASVTRVLFTEGMHVHAGDRLLQLDDRDAVAKVQTEEHVVASDAIQAKNAARIVARDARLVGQRGVSLEIFETDRANAEAAAERLRQDTEQLRLAKVGLSYAAIVSPVDGIVGLRTADPGDMVRTSDAAPITTVAGDGPWEALGSIPRAVAQTRDDLSGKKLVAFNSSGERVLTGHVSSVDSNLDSQTGTFLIRAVFDPGAYHPIGGEFLNIRVAVDEHPNAVQFPSVAVRRGAAGSYVWVVDAAGRVHPSPVVVIQDEDGFTLARPGLSPGTLVVTDGYFTLAAGREVHVGPIKVEPAGTAR